MEQELTTVHDAVIQAATEVSIPAGPMGTHTFRIHDSVKTIAGQICAAQGTTLSDFLRKCCEGLLKDYRP